MMLDQVPTVDFDEIEGRTNKFVVALLIDSDGFTKLVVVARNVSWKHDTIFGNLETRMRNGEIAVKRLGGGFIDISDKEIGLHGESMDCGAESDPQETVRLIQAAYPNLKVRSGEID